MKVAEIHDVEAALVVLRGVDAIVGAILIARVRRQGVCVGELGEEVCRVFCRVVERQGWERRKVGELDIEDEVEEDADEYGNVFLELCRQLREGAFQLRLRLVGLAQQVDLPGAVVAAVADGVAGRLVDADVVVGVLLLVEAVFAQTARGVDAAVVAVVHQTALRDRRRADVARVAPGLVFHLVQVERLVEGVLVDLVPGAGVQDEPLLPREDEVVELVVVREGEVERPEEQRLVLVLERPEPGEQQQLVHELSGEPRVLVVVAGGIGIRRGGHGVLQSRLQEPAPPCTGTVLKRSSHTAAKSTDYVGVVCLSVCLSVCGAAGRLCRGKRRCSLRRHSRRHSRTPTRRSPHPPHRSTALPVLPTPHAAGDAPSPRARFLLLRTDVRASLYMSPRVLQPRPVDRAHRVVSGAPARSLRTSLRRCPPWWVRDGQFGRRVKLAISGPHVGVLRARVGVGCICRRAAQRAADTSSRAPRRFRRR